MVSDYFCFQPVTITDRATFCRKHVLSHVAPKACCGCGFSVGRQAFSWDTGLRSVLYSGENILCVHIDDERDDRASDGPSIRTGTGRLLS